MFIEISDEKIISISKKLNIYDESLLIEDLKDLTLDTIEKLAKDKDWEWKKTIWKSLNFMLIIAWTLFNYAFPYGSMGMRK